MIILHMFVVTQSLGKFLQYIYFTVVTLGAFEINKDQIFSIEMLANCMISFRVFNPCCADTRLSNFVWSESIQTTSLVYLSLTLACLAHIILPTVHSNKVAIVLQIHSLHHKDWLFLFY